MVSSPASVLGASYFILLYTEHVDIKEAAKRNIRVGYTPDVLTDAGIAFFFSSK